MMRSSSIRAAIGGLALLISSSVNAQTGDFCKNLPRAQYANYHLHSASNDWFEVYEVEPNIFAIYEPHQWQEVISYLIIGEEKALLFDTGNGMGDIKAVVDELTALPIIVVNSHAHIDHVGGNHQFEQIVSIPTRFTHSRRRGSSNLAVREEASKAALCKPLPEGVTVDNHHIKPYEITETVESGHQIDIGGRILELHQMPGHTSDSLVMVDKVSGFMWTGDTYYTGPIWLFAPQTNLRAYRETINKLADMAKDMKVLFPAHNVPKANPEELIKVRDGFEKIITGQMDPSRATPRRATYEFPTFSFIMRRKHAVFD